MTASSTFADRLKVAIKGESLHAFSKRCGVGDSTLRKYLTGATPGLENLVAIAEAADVTLDWLATGRGEMRASSSQWQNSGQQSQSQASTSEIDEEGAIQSEFMHVQRLDVSASAGFGALSADERVISLLPLPTAFLRRLGINPASANFIDARGDSMEPTISDGDLLLVDTSRTEITENGIYVVVVGNSLLVKRVQILSTGGLRLVSDNPAYEPEVVQPDAVVYLKIAGRVMWHGGVA